SNKQAEAQLRQAELARRAHVAELFNRAVGQPKDEKSEIRLGAILTLGQICKDFEDLSGPVVRLLTTYLKQEKVDYGESDPPAEIAEIIRIIGLISVQGVPSAEAHGVPALSSKLQEGTDESSRKN